MLDFFRQQRIWRRLQGIATARVADNIIAITAQLLDVLPDRGARNAEAFGHLFSRNIRIACFAKQC